MFGYSLIKTEMLDELRKELAELSAEKFGSGAGKEEKRWFIPEDQIENLLEFVEAYKKGNQLSRYRLWSFIFGLFPELEKDQKYTLNCDDIFHPYVWKG